MWVRCDLFELLSAFTFSEFVESKIKDKSSVTAIRKALDKFKIEGLSGAVAVARKHKSYFFCRYSIWKQTKD